MREGKFDTFGSEGFEFTMWM